MNKIDNRKLEEITGGTSISGTIINAIGNMFKIVLDVGRGLGSAIRRISEDKLCPLD